MTFLSNQLLPYDLLTSFIHAQGNPDGPFDYCMADPTNAK